MANDAVLPGDGRSIEVVAHPAERRRGRQTPPAQAGHCCCCCCCCLHTIGSLIGAVVAPNLGGGGRPSEALALTSYWDEEFDDDWPPRPLSPRDREGISIDPMPGRPAEVSRASRRDDIALGTYGPSAVSLFWWTSLIFAALGLVIAVFNGAEGFLIGGVILLMVFPGVQLAAAVVAALVLAISSRPDKGRQLRQVGKIILGMIIGTIAGILTMTGLTVLFTGMEAEVIGWMVVGTVVMAVAMAGLLALSRR
jgi:hypothetical protein